MTSPAASSSQSTTTATAEPRASDACFRRLVEAAPDGILKIDPAGRIGYANAQAERLFGYESGELVGQLVEQLVPTHFQAAHRTHRVRYAAQPRIGPTCVGSDVCGRRKDGSEFPVAVSLGPLEGDDEGTVVAVVRDVSRERAHDRLKDEFVATVSHELRTPLTSIVGFVDLLLAGDAGPLSEMARHYLEIVVGNGERLTAIINDLLDVSRLEAGQIKLNRAPLDLTRAVENVAAAFGLQIVAKDQTLRLDLPPGLPPAWVDAERIAQVLTNLVSNAHKYTPAGGRSPSPCATRTRHCASPSSTPGSDCRATSGRVSSPSFTGSTRLLRARRAGPGSDWRSRGHSSSCTEGRSRSRARPVTDRPSVSRSPSHPPLPMDQDPRVTFRLQTPALNRLIC